MSENPGEKTSKDENLKDSGIVKNLKSETKETGLSDDQR